MTEPSRVAGWGLALPCTVVTNHDLEAWLDTSDGWIVERSGIHDRHIGGTVSDLTVEACQASLDREGIAPSSVELLILATCTPEEVIPHTSSVVHHRLGLDGGAMDVNGACAGFISALLAGFGAIATGANRVLVAGADCMSQITDPTDRSTAVLFADGAGAILLEATAGPKPGDGGPGLVAHHLGSDGSAHDLLACRHQSFLTMDGREVFRRAVRATVTSATAAMDRAHISADEIALFVPHQANLRIIEAAGSRLGIPMERTALTIAHTGNTSAASIPIALAEAVDAGRVVDGDLLLLSAVGAGMSWGSLILRWGT